jgi:hypothetical protein
MQDMTGGHKHAQGRNIGALIGQYIIYLPLAGFLVNLVIALAGGADDWKVTTLKVGLTWLVGVNGIALGSGHLFMPVPVAASIGWPTSRFQWEVGLAGVGYGVARWATSGRCSPSTTSRRAMPATSSGTTSWPRSS